MKEKLKSSKKLIIGLVAALVVAVVTFVVLNLTGVINLNFSKKSQMVAGVEKFTESFTEPVETLMESFEKNDNQVKLLENFDSNSAAEMGVEISTNIDTIEINDLSSTQKETLETIIDLVNKIKLSVDLQHDGNQSIYGKIAATLNSTKLSGEAVYDGENASFRSEELNSKWLTISNKELEEVMDESGVDFKELKETLNNSLEQLAEIQEKAQIDEKTQKELRKRYEDVLKKYIDDKAKDINSESAKVTVDGKEKRCKKLSVTLNEKDLKNLAKKYIDTFKNDTQLKDILKQYAEATESVLEEAGEFSAASSIEELYNNLDELKNEIDELELNVKVKLNVYATTTNVYRTDIEFSSDNNKVSLKTTYNKNETEIKISTSSMGQSIDIGTLKIKSDKNSVVISGKLSSFLAASLGSGDFSFDMSIKTDKLKNNVTLNVNAGDIGSGKISVDTNIGKNDTKEYSDTSELSVDLNFPSLFTVKGNITVATKLKLGDSSIPTVSTNDAVNMTDETSVNAYLEEVGKNAEKIREELSKDSKLKELIDEIFEDVPDVLTNLETETAPSIPDIDPNELLGGDTIDEFLN